MSLEFRKKHYPSVSLKDWKDWKWQLRNRLKTTTQLQSFVNLTEDEVQAIKKHEGRLPLAITPYYMSLIDEKDLQDPIRKTVIPLTAEFLHSFGESEDPLGEEPNRPTPAIVHRYPDRVLLLVTATCSVYCRYCTRSRLVGDAAEYAPDMKILKEGIQYIADHKEVRDVLITGGDPLTLSDEKLDWILSEVRKIPHVEFIRIGTKVPVVLPQRITPSLCKILKKYHPLWMSIHVLHPAEITPEVAKAFARLADAGLPLGSQTVLLKGVNDNVETLKSLMHKLLMNRVKPYYLFHCDPISGSAHLRTSVEKGLEMIQGLRGHTTGYAVPHYAVDIAGKGGKVALVPSYVVGREEDQLIIKNYAGETYSYPDAAGNQSSEEVIQ
ncbi:MAG: KamA family radical SAM protein [Bdellovibrionales bacterium]